MQKKCSDVKLQMKHAEFSVAYLSTFSGHKPLLWEACLILFSLVFHHQVCPVHMNGLSPNSFDHSVVPP